jgi:RecB family exonuclease
MLNVIRGTSPEHKAELFRGFDPKVQSWVVSDLQSKWQLQKVLLEQHGVLEDGAVLRATELWKHFAFQLRPEMRLLSSELAQTLFWDWIEPMGLPWARSPRAVQVVLKQMQMWMTLFADPQAEDVMVQWFSEHQESFVRWGHWFELCSELWHRCQERHLMMMSWIPAMLLSEDLTRLEWPRSLMFDLGPQISQVEGLLVRELGKHGDVSVLYPEAPWASLMRQSLQPYEQIVGGTLGGASTWQPPRNECLQFGRFSTQLAEVKDAVARVRHWLDAGVAGQEIALIAPDIEDYWPVLRMYLRQEGIAVCKPESARLGSFAEMARWVAALRTSLNRVSAQDLEVYFFAHQDQPRVAFEKFKVLFTHIYDARDLDRARELFESDLAPATHAAQSMQDFLIWSLRFWEASAETARLLSLLQVIGKEVPRELMLKPTQWLGYLEGLLARREIALRPADERGIWCVSLSSANWLDCTHGVILNVSEGALRQVETSQVTASEARQIFTDTGFALGSPDRQELEFEFLWLLQRDWRELFLSFAGTDFGGNVMTASRLWMWSGFINDQFKKDAQAPGLTRWDELQRQTLPQLQRLREWSEAQAGGLDLGLRRDTDAGVSTWRPGEETRVSASSIERYLECPFVFAASRKFKLADDPALDLDLDRRTRGQLLHGLVEELMSEPPCWTWTDEELGELVDRTRLKHEIQVGDERLWPAVRAQHVSLGRSFLRFEQQWRERFPQTVTVGRETQFSCYWDFTEAQPTAVPSKIVLSGRLDRIDRDSKGRYALIDYKATSQNLRNWSSWIQNSSVQMALYSLLLEAGLAGVEAGPVASANYFVVRESDRRKGFHTKEPDAELYSPDDKHRNWIELEQKAALFTDLRALIQKALQGILEGRFNPSPENVKICERCAWRTLCRAPHLN